MLRRAFRFSLAFASFAIALLGGCSQSGAGVVYPTADFRPPGLLDAGPSSSKLVVLSFDESVSFVAGSLAVDPSSPLSARVEGEKLMVDFASSQSPGADYALSGEVDDLKGNRTRFLLRFTGWNDRAPETRISEVQTGKNSSKTKPHRDFIELEVLADGNLGGEELSWSSSVKSATYRFSGIEVRKGDFVVLHLAPEGLEAERDETGSNLSYSGGIDATAAGRDLWCSSMPLPDQSGAVALCLRPGEKPMDGLFYADDEKSGAVAEGKLYDLLSELEASEAWPLSGSSPTWEDGFTWKSSTSRPIVRIAAAKGPSAWAVGAASSQSPGAVNPAP
jgi:hypothetical protein